MTDRNLNGLTILNCRAARQASEFSASLQRLGANVIEHPAIEVTALTDQSQKLMLSRTIEQLDQFDVIAFVSRNGVAHFVDAVFEASVDMSELSRKQFVAIGSRTAEACKRHGWSCECPDVANSVSLSQFLIQRFTGKSILVIRATRGSSELPDALRVANVRFKQVAAYVNRDVTILQSDVRESFLNGEIDWIPLASSATAKAMLSMLQACWRQSKRPPKIASISPSTSEVIRSIGFSPSAEATRFQIDGMIEAILDHEQER